MTDVADSSDQGSQKWTAEWTGREGNPDHGRLARQLARIVLNRLVEQRIEAPPWAGPSTSATVTDPPPSFPAPPRQHS